MRGLVRHNYSATIPSISIKSFEVLLAYYLETSGKLGTTTVEIGFGDSFAGTESCQCLGRVYPLFCLLS